MVEMLFQIVAKKSTVMMRIEISGNFSEKDFFEELSGINEK